MKDTVLIVTQVADVHADAVVAHLREREIPVFRLHTADFPSQLTLSLDVRASRCTGELATPHHRLSLERVASVWMRRPATPVVSDDLDPSAREYALEQSSAALTALYASIDALWVGAPARLRVANVKPLQLIHADAVGLSTPVTLISNDPARVAFREELRGRDCAVKPLEVVGVQAPDGYRFPLTQILPAKADAVGAPLAPSMLQAYVEKAFELRCVVIGDEVFAASIYSQEQPETTVDWRGGDPPFEAYSLPDHIRDAALALVRRLGLNYASMDFIVTPDGDHVFLELNPNGQFLWLEYDAGLPLSSRMADLLASARSCVPATGVGSWR